ncbi:hypothetical protein ARAM_003071 [Aspergillus rambellii]|uniref:Zn(2)-C6 fungal-type domain-containing protein n=2 Tax=Aspergillus subgen. Nidulantes TaxID=2720870 RepID=A0A0F8U9U4_9EURO|nr:hypothetical protein ARAM_003071 [Aspergillus rambellii]
MDLSLLSPPAVSALRDSFGDRKPPDITRKITACVACRKQKVKCHMREGQTPCTRCHKRGLSCTVNRSLQMILEDDATWKNSVVQKIRWLDETVAKIATKVDLPELQSSSSPSHVVSPEYHLPPMQHHTPPTTSEPEQAQIWEVVMDPQGGPASIPAACVSEVRSTRASGSFTSAGRPDLISIGVLSLPQALALFDVYCLRLDHFLYRILGDHTSLDSIRRTSPLLTAAVCTVGTLHSRSLGHLFEACYREYKNVVAAQTFSSSVNEDDVRGLCIGAFWLHELSWALIGTAVRIASDIKLHHGIYRALHGDRVGYLQARLYYLVYVCDHHFSVAYGRPPMSREGLIIDSAGRFLEIEHATEDDARLVSQVKEWSVLSQVFDTFGVDIDAPVPAQKLPQLRRYSIALDTWYADWNETFCSNRNVGNYPQKGVGFHFHFAKLYLCSHAFRGAATQGGAPCLTPDMEEIANTGVLSAMSILRVIVSDEEFRSFLNGLPLYFDTMLAFAVVFLLKVATKYATTIRIDTGKILSLVAKTVEALQEITHSMHRQHILVVIADGLGKLLSKCQEPTTHLGEAIHPSPAPEQPSQEDMTWMGNMTNFDFLSNMPDGLR